MTTTINKLSIFGCAFELFTFTDTISTSLALVTVRIICYRFIVKEMLSAFGSSCKYCVNAECVTSITSTPQYFINRFLIPRIKYRHFCLFIYSAKNFIRITSCDFAHRRVFRIPIHHQRIK